MSGEGASWPPDYCRLVFIDGDGLTEADISLSATRFPEVAAAVLEILQLYPVIAHQKPRPQLLVSFLCGYADHFFHKFARYLPLWGSVSEESGSG
jgi:hypothetical protein